MKKKRRERLERIYAAVEGKLPVEELTNQELLELNELMYETVEKIHADRLVRSNSKTLH